MSGIPGIYKNQDRRNGQLPDPRRFPPGTVGVTAAEIARFTSFTHSLAGVTAALPPGSGLILQCSVDICGNLNTICRNYRGEWVWIMGDDHVFDQGILLRLLEHLEKPGVDVVVPHCLKRTPGWEPVVFSHQDDDGWYHIAELPPRGLTQVHAAGSAGMLISRRVLEAVGDPWFTPSQVGLGEDLEFCRKVREAGFGIHCDPEILLGHTSLHTVWPEYRNGRWHVSLLHDQKVSVPITRLHDDYEPIPLKPVSEEVPA